MPRHQALLLQHLRAGPGWIREGYGSESPIRMRVGGCRLGLSRHAVSYNMQTRHFAWQETSERFAVNLHCTGERIEGRYTDMVKSTPIWSNLRQEPRAIHMV